MRKSIVLISMKLKKCEASDQKILSRKSEAIVSFDPTNKLPRTFFRGSLAVAGAVKVIEKHNRS